MHSSPPDQPPRPPLVMDMVHHNPGEPRYATRFDDPRVLREMGYNARCFPLFDSPTLAIDWADSDPDVFPPGSPGRAWVDAKAAFLDREMAANHAAGIASYAMGDLILLPKALVEKHRVQETFGDPRHPLTQNLLRQLIAGTFRRFPLLDGLVVRIGETYLHDAPHHAGKIQNPFDPERTIIPLLSLLREEICVKLGKRLVFRTWNSFDRSPADYAKVDAAVEPHPLLIISIKHCEEDFHRANRFSRSIGQGRHPQIIEIQCAREYEGKGAYPNYLGHGILEGLEEHRTPWDAEDSSFRSIGAFGRRSPLYAGVWTWTRGGGWEGPYIKHELWPDLNAWVFAQWALAPFWSEETFFRRYASEKLQLAPADAERFRRLCLHSADAALRGRCPIAREHTVWWTRDEYLNAPVVNPGTTPEQLRKLLAWRDESVSLWAEMAALADSIAFPDAATGENVRVSCRYGLHLYRIHRAAWRLFVLTTDGDRVAISRELADYDAAWRDYRALPATSELCATLYQERGSPHTIRWFHIEGIDTFVSRFRAVIQP